MKKIVTFLMLSILSMCVTAQQPQFEWAKRFGGMGADGGMSIALDNAGNVYTAGYMSDTVEFPIGPDTLQLVSADGSADIIVTKQDAEGNFIWAKQMGGPMASQANYIAVNGLGNLVITGSFTETVDFDPGPGVFEMTAIYQDIFIVSLTTAGEFIWAKQITSDYNDIGQTIAIDPVDGSILVTGYFTGTADFDPGPGYFELSPSYLGNYDLFLLKLDVNGNFRWAVRIGADNFDAGMGVAVNASSEIFLTGFFAGTVDFDPGADVYEMVASYGDLLGYGDGFVCKLGSNGRFIWAKQFGVEGDDWAYSIAIDDNGNTYTTGMFQGSVDFDPGAGEQILNSNSNSWDAFIWKLDTNGNLVWVRDIVDGPLEAWGNAITVDNLGNPYVTGFFNETADFDPGENVYSLTAGAHWEIFISKLTTAGNFSWAVAMGGNTWYDLNTQQGFGIVVDDDDNVYSTGTFESFTDFDPGPAIYYLQADLVLETMFYYEDAYIHKMSQTTVAIHEDIVQQNGFSLYPNPVNDVLTIGLGSEYSEIRADVIDVTGKLLLSENYNKTRSINIRIDVKPGIYIIRLMDQNGMIANLKVFKK
jgi:hypothetical protein